MFVGPIFYRELAVAPRRTRFFVDRAAYAAGFMLLISTAWAVMSGNQILSSVGDLARFGIILFDVMAPLQLALILFYAPVLAASTVAQEKDKQTLILLLMTRLSNGELVLGKLLASLVHVLVLLLASLPIFSLVVLFGGVSFAQVGRVFAVTAVAGLAAGSLGTMVAFWREKTFQTLAMVALILFVWLGVWEAVYAGLFGSAWGGYPTTRIATAFDPLRAINLAARPAYATHNALGWNLATDVLSFLTCGLLITVVLCSIAILRVRIWNPSRQLMLVTQDDESPQAIWGDKANTAGEASLRDETARAGHVDARLRHLSRQPSRNVWDNPVLWREICTWAHGRKVLVVRAIYVLLVAFIAVAAGRIQAASGGSAAAGISTMAKLLVPLFLLSLVILNALAVTSVTTERDGRSLDLLLATDLSPSEFVFGKLLGVLTVAGLMVLAPMVLAAYVCWRGGLSGENFVYVTLGLAVMNVFVAMLGVHCATRYANSRTAISVSLGTVFFLFLGVAACTLMMQSFSGSFQVQMAPFLAFILGGGVAMFAALGTGNPSSAIAAASIGVPFLTFHAITSFLLGHYLTVFLVIVTAYGFATAAMLVPALNEFDFAMGRTSMADE